MSAKKKKIQLYLRRLIREICGAPDVDINDALATAQLAHLGQRRRSGEEYIEHPKQVAQIVYNYYQDPVLCAAALLHDTLEDAVAQGNAETDEEMASLIAGSFGNPELGDDVLRLVRSLTHEKSTDYTSYLIDLAADPQALKVKLADVLHNLSSSPSEKQLLKYKTALEALRAEYGEPPAGISGAHWEALKNIVKLDAPVKDMREVILRKYVREILVERSAGTVEGSLPGLERNLVQDMLLARYAGRQLTGEMGEAYAELFFPGQTTQNTNPKGFSAGGDSSFADIVVGTGEDKTFYSVKASTPGRGKSATAGAILGNASIKPSSLQDAIDSGLIPKIEIDKNGKKELVVNAGAVAFGLRVDDHPLKNPEERGNASSPVEYPIPTQVWTYIWTGQLPITIDDAGKVKSIAGDESMKGTWGSTKMDELFGTPDQPERGNLEIDEAYAIRLADEVFERQSGASAITDTFQQVRIAGQKIANAIESGEDVSGENVQNLKKNRAKLEKRAAELEKVVDAIKREKEFEVTIVEALVREILREDAK